MKSWKTNLAGLIVALGGALKTAPGLPEWAPMAGDLLIAFGAAAIGFFARDNKVTSEQVGAKLPFGG